MSDVNFAAQPEIKKIANGIFESSDEKGYKDYIFKRNVMKEVSQLKVQINNMNGELAEIKQMLQQIIKAN